MTLAPGEKRMRILLVTHYFPPEIGAPQTRLSEFAKMWTEAGHDVTVLTGMPNHPTGIVPQQYRRKLRLREKSDQGYSIVRTWLYATANEGVVKKSLGHLSFMLSSVLLGHRLTQGADVVIVSSPTFFSIFSAWILARMKRAHFVIEVRDLWPAIFVELGVIKNKRIIRALELLELRAYRAADGIVVVSEGFRRDLLRRGVPQGKIRTIRNGVDVDRFDTFAGDSDGIRRRLGAKSDDILVLYLGAHGVSHALERIVEVAGLVDNERIRFAFVGEGATRVMIERLVQESGYSHVTLASSVPADQVPGVIAAADICLVPLRDVPLFTTFIPSKMFEFLAAARPIIGSVRGEAAGILQDAGQVVVDPEDVVAIAEAISRLGQDERGREEMGARGRAFVRDNFARRVLARDYLEFLADIITMEN
jgi:glycosyltransferase involved in cell wall biosynthesis